MDAAVGGHVQVADGQRGVPGPASSLVGQNSAMEGPLSSPGTGTGPRPKTRPPAVTMLGPKGYPPRFGPAAVPGPAPVEGGGRSVTGGDHSGEALRHQQITAATITFKQVAAGIGGPFASLSTTRMYSARCNPSTALCM